MSEPVHVLGKYGIGPWGKSWGAVWYIDTNKPNWWITWRWQKYNFSNDAHWIWNIKNAANNAPSYIPIRLKYTYNNTTGKEIKALFYYISDNDVQLFINNKEVLSTWWWEYGRQRLYVVLKDGVNHIEARCKNYGGPAGLIADVRKIDDNQLLFSTNSEWTYDTNFTKKLFNLNYCDNNNSSNGYMMHDNISFDVDNQDDNKAFDNKNVGGGRYLLLSRQTVNNDKFYDKKVSLSHKLNENDPNNPNYMNGALLNSSFKIRGKYVFKLVWPNSGLQPQIWKQESDPFKERKVRGYQYVNAPHNYGAWGGLRFNGGPCVLSGSTNSWWWYAVGSFQKYGNGLPATNGISVKQVELYVLKSEVGNYEALGNTFVWGNNMSYTDVPHDKCADKCDTTPGCKAFTQIEYGNRKKGCYLSKKPLISSEKYTWSGYKSYNKKHGGGAIDDTIIPTDSDSIKPIGAYGDSGNRALPTYLGNTGYNKNNCANAAKRAGYKYFGLQCPGCGVQCFAGNDLNRAKMYGPRNSGTYGAGWVNYVYENKDSGSTITPKGSYRDTQNRALRYGPHNWGYTTETCKAACPTSKYIALQDGNGQTGWCSCDNDWNHVTKYGPKQCGKTGGPWCNSVYEVEPKKPKNTNEQDCTDKCNKTNGCIGYSFNKNKVTDNCNMFKKIPKYYSKNNGVKIAFKPSNLSNFKNLDKQEQDKIKKKCGDKFLSKKFNIEEDTIGKCMTLKNNGDVTTGFDINPECLYNNLNSGNTKKKNKMKNTGLDNLEIVHSKGNDNIDKNITQYNKYIDKEVKFANYNNKEIIKNPDNVRENTENIINVFDSGKLDYLEEAEDLQNEIDDKIYGNNMNNIEKFQNKDYLDNIKFNKKKWYIYTVLIILLILFIYYLKF